jgi:hypothetical protein
MGFNVLTTAVSAQVASIIALDGEKLERPLYNNADELVRGLLQSFTVEHSQGLP